MCRNRARSGCGCVPYRARSYRLLSPSCVCGLRMEPVVTSYMNIYIYFFWRVGDGSLWHVIIDIRASSLLLLLLLIYFDVLLAVEYETGSQCRDRNIICIASVCCCLPNSTVNWKWHRVLRCLLLLSIFSNTLLAYDSCLADVCPYPWLQYAYAYTIHAHTLRTTSTTCT